jgi:predicted Zn-ribbon and HTH transcriptional regulator
MDLVEIARHLEVPQKDAEDDLKHLIKSLNHTDDRLVVTPAYCRKCDFTFNKDNCTSPASVRNVTARGYRDLCLISNRNPELRPNN